MLGDNAYKDPNHASKKDGQENLLGRSHTDQPNWPPAVFALVLPVNTAHSAGFADCAGS